MSSVNEMYKSLEGGSDCNYFTVTGITVMNGDMIISNGRVIVENFELQ